MKNHLLALSLALGLLANHARAMQSVSLQTLPQHLQNDISALAISDFNQLMGQACQCNTNPDNREAAVQLLLPEIGSPTPEPEGGSPLLPYPKHNYAWTATQTGSTLVLQLHATSYNGIAFGLYGLLQEKLGFSFYHPRHTIVPDLTGGLPLPNGLEWHARPRFAKKGFHIHTMHPLELTEALLDPTHPNAWPMVKEYLDWLARNGQNYFEFNLLESIEPEQWLPHAKRMVDYAHRRGILAGLDLSLHMIQQKAFMLYRTPPAYLKTKERQIKNNLDMLFAADWDVLNVEFSSTEFTEGNKQKKQQLQLQLTDWLENEYHCKLMGRKHVVKESEMAVGKQKPDYEMTGEERALDRHRGEMIHTVMFYTMSEERAPVYENENLRHMLDLLLQKLPERETWYFPESAYWVTFDNSVPMLLLPYLNARLDDILLSDSLGVEGHLTFSSGWEWGYRLIDWSIARWSWEHTQNGKTHQARAGEFFNALFPNKHELNGLLLEALNLQQQYIKDKELIRYMDAQTVTDEMPKPLRLEFHPRPRWSYAYMRRKASAGVLDSIEREAILPLRRFAAHCENLCRRLQAVRPSLASNDQLKAFDELYDGIEITGLRAQHRALTLEYLLQQRRADIDKTPKRKRQHGLLQQAADVRSQAQQTVNRREAAYLYPVDDIARKRWGHTCYRFGYLYPVSNLHFWEREEEQARRNRWGPLFKNIWNIPRTIGLVD